MPSELSPDSNTDQSPIPDQQDSLRRKFGVNFPQLTSTDGTEWRRWIESERKRQEPIMRDKRLHWARHRHFRAGHQWISTRDGRTWREPQADVNDLRPVLNLVGPALDFRLGILSEQKPGFKFMPIGTGVEGREAAEAQQAVTEYYFYTLRTWNTFQDAWFQAQTDGCSFIHIYVDMNSGPSRQDVDLIDPTDERFAGLQAQGYNVNEQGLLELPYQEEGVEAPPGSEPRLIYEGEIVQKLLLAHEVLFSPEARTINGPNEPKAKWALIRRMRDVNEARIETGNPKIESELTITSQSDVLDMPIDRSMGWQRGLPPFPTRRQRIIDGVPEYILYIAPDKNEPGLELGIWKRIIGNVIVEDGDELPGGVIPLARFTDGSPDTDIYPRPVMSDWIGDQVLINALLSSLAKHNRFFAGGRILATKNTLLEETYSNIVGSVVEYQGMKPEVFPPIVAGQDAWKQIDWMVKKFEDKSGWNDLARGQISQTGSAQDVSGRAVLASQQLFERAFGPAVRAAAEGATEWALIIVSYSQWLFEEPRLIPAVGERGDLAKKISSETLGTLPMVYCDPETMMPMPRALSQQLLEDQLDKGRITLATYQKRSVYSDIRNLQMGDSDQWQRAQFVNTLITERWKDLVPLPPPERYAPQGTPILWQDDVIIHKEALMEIITDERKPWGMRQVCLDRWGVYDELQRAQIDPTGMVPIPPVVLGVPVDKLMAQQAMMGGQPAGPVAGPPNLGQPPVPTTPAPGGSGGLNPALPIASPTPDQMGTIAPAVADQAKGLASAAKAVDLQQQ